MLQRTFIILGCALLLSGCKDEMWTLPNADHCTWNGGDSYCAERSPETPYCNTGEGECSIADRFGCVAEVAPECHAPCGEPGDLSCVGGESSTGVSSESGSGSETEGSSGSESSSTTGPMPCVSDEECTEAEAPFCGVNGECGGCEGTVDPDGACAGVDPLLPLCVGGACVACTPEDPAACTGTTPVCDGATNTCVPCTAHDQCGEAACNLYTGACLPGDADAIAHVGPGQEIASLNEAVMSFPGMEGTVVVHQADFNEAVLVDAARTVAFLAAEGDSPVWALIAGGAPQLEVTAGSTVLMDGLTLSDGDLGLRVDGGRAWVDRSRIIQNSGGGVLAESGAELVLRNCFVGGAVSDVDAIALDASSLDMLYSTVGGGPVLGGRSRALYCQGALAADIRNSILVSADPMTEVECPGAALTDSATETEVGMLNIMWFMGYATGDFSLSPMGATTFADVAQWTIGDPPIDIDGDSRPAVDGTPDYAGADVPQ